MSLPSGTVASSQSPSIVQKSDKIRIIARQDVAITVEGSSGASVVVNSNGDIYLTPSASGKVYLSGPESDQGYVKHDKLMELLDLITTLLENIGTVASSIDAAGLISGPLSALQLNGALIKSEIESNKILGS